MDEGIKGLFVYKDEDDLDRHLRRWGVDVNREDKLVQNSKVKCYDYKDIETTLNEAEWTMSPPRPYMNVYFSDKITLRGNDVNLIISYYVQTKQLTVKRG